MSDTDETHDTTTRRAAGGDGYHHHDLPATLRAATAELVAERGPRGFSLREVARRAGVSHAAPGHHFGDARGLLTAVSVEGFDHLADAMESALVGCVGARDRLRACGKAYVATALTHPGHYAVMLDDTIHDRDDECHQEAGMRAFGLLVDAVTDVRDELNADLDIEAAATVCWSAMHGVIGVSHALDDIAERFGTPVRHLETRIDEIMDLILDGLVARDAAAGAPS